MATHPTPTVHWFQEINPGKFTSIRHYELVGVKNGNNILCEKINISKDRQECNFDLVNTNFEKYSSDRLRSY